MMPIARIHGLVLSLASLAALTGCATLTGMRREPVDIHQFEPKLTVGVPAEKPLSPIRTEGLSSEEIGTVTVYRHNIRAVVNVMSLRLYRNLFQGEFPVAGTGSGFILDQQGHVVTNYHVVKGAESLIITMYDGSNYRADVIGHDADLDLAVLKFDPQGRKLDTITLGDSDTLQIGQRVLALGNPFGLEGTLTAGIVSGLRRPMRTESGFIIRNLIQSDAAINPGNSGGPLLNSSGQLVGINVMILSPSGGSVGISFSIPSNVAVRVVHQIISGGKVSRGWIQFTAIALDPQIARAAGLGDRRGLLITHVVPGGNAASAGLRDGSSGRYVQTGAFVIPVEGDVILAVDGQPVGSVIEYLSTLETTQPGDVVTLTVLRDQRTIEVPVVLSRRPEQ